MQLTFEGLPLVVGQIYDKLENIERLLQQKTNGSSMEPEQLLDINQAAILLKLSRYTLYGLVSKATIPVSKRGKRLYFSKNELTEWAKAGKIKTKAEIQSEAHCYLQPKKRRA